MPTVRQGQGCGEEGDRAVGAHDDCRTSHGCKFNPRATTMIMKPGTVTNKRGKEAKERQKMHVINLEDGGDETAETGKLRTNGKRRKQTEREI